MATAGPPCSAHEENVPRTTYRSTSPPSSATKHQTRHSTARHVHVSSHPKTCPSSSVVHVPYYSTATGPASTPSNPPSAAYRRPDRQPTATDDRDSIFSRPPTVARQNAKGHNRKSLPHSLVTSLYFPGLSELPPAATWRPVRRAELDSWPSARGQECSAGQPSDASDGAGSALPERGNATPSDFSFWGARVQCRLQSLSRTGGVGAELVVLVARHVRGGLPTDCALPGPHRVLSSLLKLTSDFALQQLQAQDLPRMMA
jgi:hypothetical protein